MTENGVNLETTLKEQILLQVERLGVLESSLESARLNQGITNKFIEWIEGEMARMAIQLNSAALRADRLENDICEGERNKKTNGED